MELKNIEALKEEIAYLEEAEELLNAIWCSFNNPYELGRKLRENPCLDKNIESKLYNHFNFDDSE